MALTDDGRAVVLSYLLQAPPAGASETVLVIPSIDKARQIAQAILGACEQAGRVRLATPGEVPPLRQ